MFSDYVLIAVLLIPTCPSERKFFDAGTDISTYRALTVSYLLVSNSKKIVHSFVYSADVVSRFSLGHIRVSSDRPGHAKSRPY